MHEHRIAALWVEVRRQHVEAVDQVSPAAGEFEGVTLIEYDALQSFGAIVAQQAYASLPEIDAVGAVPVAEALGSADQKRAGFAEVERLHIVLRHIKGLSPAIGRVDAVNPSAVLVLGKGVDHAVSRIPLRIGHRWIEIRRERLHTAVGEFHTEELYVEAVWNLTLLHPRPYAPEGLRGACEQQGGAIRRETAAVQEAVTLDHTLGLESFHIHYIE